MEIHRKFSKFHDRSDGSDRLMPESRTNERRIKGRVLLGAAAVGSLVLVSAIGGSAGSRSNAENDQSSARSSTSTSSAYANINFHGLLPAKPFNVVEYNSSYNVKPKKKKAEIIALLKKHTDFLGVVEYAGDDKDEDIKAEIPLCETCEYDGFIPDDKNSESAAFWRTDRFKMDSFEYIQLHSNTDSDGHIIIRNASGSYSTIKQKTLTIVCGVDLYDKLPICFEIAHAIYKIQAKIDGLKLDEKERLAIYEKEASAIVAKALEKINSGKSLVVLGDFNLLPNQKDKNTLENMLKKIGMASMYETNVKNLTPDEKYTHDRTKQDLDYVMVFSPALSIIDRKNLGDWESDHDPIFVRIIRKNNLISIQFGEKIFCWYSL